MDVAWRQIDFKEGRTEMCGLFLCRSLFSLSVLPHVQFIATAMALRRGGARAGDPWSLVATNWIIRHSYRDPSLGAEIVAG